MDKKKIVKIIAIIIAIIAVLVLFTSSSFAAGLTGDDIKNSANNFINTGKNNSPISAEQIGSILKPLANILLAVGTVVVVVIGTVMAIKYITASPDEQGKLKKQLVGLVISTIVLYGAYGIWVILYNFLSKTF